MKHTGLPVSILLFFALVAICCSGCTKPTDTGTGKPVAPAIIYTDRNPGAEVSGTGSYGLDLNNDGIIDFNFIAFSDSVKCDPRSPEADGRVQGAQVTIPTGSNNAIVFKLNQNYSACLDSLTLIDSTRHWSYVTNQALSMYGLSTCTGGYYPSFGNWFIAGNESKFMGLKLIIGSGAYYGWVRLYVDINVPEMIVRDYAYNSVANQPILAGQMR